ncbi:hypothetical protein IMG5_090950 [Ichthyophthirius multifiliis]|uniref:Sperm-tail PG-rich repeat protein n=1 Tax=Ichthyophthirius multifiliis TaxID=5932 RepID=G0QR94_ICHMU|nr:hypothetical protein IMG5_090950 [Ichthyophthirius multifiliis]EGR32246.1 hypothetical protein IMG5_090950 [Ichthyophthirius multifiliis]|eukprot:XP_004035732.1 hypothetical protein IMG5_090950 [Ichthyophthirius multifiliis]
MAFVYLSEKNQSYVKSSTNDLLGPGCYIQHKKYTIPKAVVPFNSSQLRAQQKKEKIQTPGPGQYQIQKQNLSEKIVISSANEDIKIVEIPKPQSIFKSTSQRFQQNIKQMENPGPGQYEQQSTFYKNTSSQIKQNNNLPYNKQNMVDHLMKLNHYQSTPSIPSKYHAFGYTENENNELALNKMPSQQFTGTKSDSIGPGHYNLKDTIEINKNKGSAWHKYQAARLNNNKKQKDNVGPGTYDLQGSQMPLYKMKQSPGFASKTLRCSIGLQKVANKFSQQRKVKSQQSHLNLKNKFFEQNKDEEIEFIDETTPGPGHYHNENITTSIKLQGKAEKFQNFGGYTASRFQIGSFGQTIGPGEYNPQTSGFYGKNLNETKARNPPFLSSNSRFEIKKIIEHKPGPGTYDARINLEDKLIKNIQKGYRGNFGTTQRRFNDENIVYVIIYFIFIQKYNQQEQPGPGTYIQVFQENQENQENNLPQAVFRSTLDRSVFDNQKDSKPPVGSYKLDYYNIEKKVIKEPEDPDIKIKVPNLGFNTSEQRFKDLKKNKKEKDDENKSNSLIRYNQSNKEIKKTNIHFLTKAERFNYKDKNQAPPPGTYFDEQQNLWNKRTYNIHFADF